MAGMDTRCSECPCRWDDCMDEKPDATIFYTTEAHDGPGWYYYESDYPDEGCVGAFDSRRDAIAHARESGYEIQSEPPASAEGGE